MLHTRSRSESVSVHCSSKGRALRYLSVRGGLSLALRRIISGVSARRFGFIVQVDIHRTTICRWEQLLAASLHARSRAWYIDRQTHLYRLCDHCVQSDLPKPARVAMHIHRGDATNTTLIGKLHVRETKSIYVPSRFATLQLVRKFGPTSRFAKHYPT